MATRPLPPSDSRTVSEPHSRSLIRLRSKIHQAILSELDERGGQPPPVSWVTERAGDLLKSFAPSEGIVPTARIRERIVADVIHEVFGFGPIQALLDDPTVMEIIVNSPDCVIVERDGQMEDTDRGFDDDRHIVRVVQKILSGLGRRLDESSPMVDARLPDGSRVNAIIPPVAVSGPSLTIRKFAKVGLTKEDLLQRHTLTPEILTFLEACVRGRLNIIVSGSSSTGKTTTLNVLSSFINPRERVVTIEDTVELQINLRNLVSLESRPVNIEGQGDITIRDLVRNAMRMRPDRIIVGEVRGGETLDMIQSMLTGHLGSMSTVHSSSTRDTIHRMETMSLMAGLDLPARGILRQIASAIDVIVHLRRFPDGTRRITHVTEILGMDAEGVVLQDIFTFQQKQLDGSGKVKGEYMAASAHPLCLEKMKDHLVEPLDWVSLV